MASEKQLMISVAIATYNEAENIGRCLRSVVRWADEIVLVDGGSTDATLEIAKAFGVRLILTDNPQIFHINKQKALAACRGSWILQLDADEVVSRELADEIYSVTRMRNTEILSRRIDPGKMKLFMKHQKLLESRDGAYGNNNHAEVAAFFVPRRNFFFGQPMTYAGLYPDGVIRLVRKGRATFPAQSVHEQIRIDGRVSWLENDLLHYSNPTWSRYWLGASRYTDLLASEIGKLGRKGQRLLWLDYCFIRPVRVFWSLFFRHKGFLDGVSGLLFSLLSAVHFPIAFFKYLKGK